jgi:outer membrane protein OmpA-like peptidoglycan-associated protein
MASVSPYSGKFAGRTIESGRLDAKLEYKIRKAQMRGDNQFTITRLKLGPHVDSPEAINLPLDLAIAVLENSDGVIDLDLPVSGDLNNPKFSYGHIVWQAIVNVLTKIVTAPFRALGALFGGSAEQAPQDVRFVAGSAALAPPERERLLQIAEALAKRPRLELQVPPTSDPALDTAALQDAAVRRQVLQKLGVTVAPDASPGPLDLGDARTRNAVQALYLDHFPTSALNALGRSLPKKEAESHALQRAMLQQVAKTVVIPDSDLRALAQARAQAVAAALTTGAKALPAARVQIVPPTKDQATSGDAVVLKLGLGTAPAASAPAVSASAPAGAAPAQGR